MSQVSAALSAKESAFLVSAADYLERPTFLTKVAALVGKPTSVVLSALPSKASEMVEHATSHALKTALDWAVRSIGDPAAEPAPPAAFDADRGRTMGRLHAAVTAGTGALGGFFGLAGLAVELPTTTTVMLRSIAQIAAQYGADLRDPQTRLECISVFSFGSPSLDTMESAYLTGRLGIAVAVRDAAAFVGAHTAREVTEAVGKHSAPVLVRLISQVASRFQVVVTEKVLAQAVPLAGAATGALINAAFTEHFNQVARYHFGIVELERRYGREVVQLAYQAARAKLQPAEKPISPGG